MAAYETLSDTSEWGVTGREALHRRRLELIPTLDWRLANGNTIDRLPFPILILGKDHKSVLLEQWPPRGWLEIIHLFSILQTANYNIVAFATGARWSEHAATSLDCVVNVEEPLLHSKTFKLIGLVGGKNREWPLIEEAVAAIKCQQRYARIVAGSNAESLWVNVKSNAGTVRTCMNGNNNFFVKALGLEHLAGGNPSTHRWRVTMARLGAMALIEAPRVLMLLFGHRSVEMTLRYILSNDDIRAELELAYCAAAYAQTKELIDGADQLQGPAAPTFRSALEALQTDIDGNGAMAPDEPSLIHALSVIGKVTAKVRPGIDCMKQPGQIGPCATGYGAPNPSRCKVSCSHRLETPVGEEHAASIIEFLLKELESKAITEQPLVGAELKGQMLTQLRRFSTVRDFWIAKSQFIKMLWDDAHVSVG